MTDMLYVILGLDAQGVPHGARFATEDRETAIKAAEAMGYRFIEISDPGAVAVATTLPEGKIYATGKSLAPRIKRETYERLVAGVPPTVATTADVAPEKLAPWDQVTVGHHVLAYCEDEGAWWEVEVLGVMGGGGALRVAWHGEPDMDPFIVQRRDVALIASGLR